jgi:hypothetical protein
MCHFSIGDQVLVINSTYNPDLIGHVGAVAHCADLFAGYDKNGCFISGKFVVVDLPNDINRYGTTLWYFQPEHLIKISPDKETGIKSKTAIIY